MEKLFSTKERINILRHIIYAEKPIGVSSVASELKVSKGLVSKYMCVLVSEGIARRSGGKYLVIDSAATKAIRILLNIKSIDIRIFKRHSFIEAVGLFGSCAKGENTETSDIDLWIRIKDAGENRLASLTAEISEKIRNAKPLFLSAKKIEKMRKEDELFYHSLAFGSIVLYGARDGIQFNDCMKQGLLRRILPSREKARQSIKKAQGWLKEAEDSLKGGAIN